MCVNLHVTRGLIALHSDFGIPTNMYVIVVFFKMTDMQHLELIVNVTNDRGTIHIKCAVT